MLKKGMYDSQEISPSSTSWARESSSVQDGRALTPLVSVVVSDAFFDTPLGVQVKWIGVLR